jgi:long-chain acyl-CoA synthetase
VLTLASLPWTAALRAPHAPALHSGPHTLDFRSLDRAATSVAAELERRGIDAQQRIAICCGNGLAFPALYYGALRRTAVVVLLPTSASVAEMARTIRHLRVRLVAADAENADRAYAATTAAGSGARTLVLRDGGGTPCKGDHLTFDALVDDHPSTAPQPVPPHTPAVVIPTSGTTGMPKGALHSHAGLLLNARAVAGEMLHLGEDDVQLGALPLPHSFGMSAVLNASVLAGAAVALMPRFDPEAARALIALRRVTVVQGVPTMLSRLAAAAPPTAAATTLRRVVVSGAPLPSALAAAVHQHLCSDVVERYGMTEVSPLTMRPVPPDGGEQGDVGRPLWGVAVRVAGGRDSGELEATAPSMFLRYAADRRATEEALVDGFFRTGDLGRVDPEDGRVILTGRAKDLIIRGGYNVAPREVEHVLEGHHAVAEVAVVGLPDADLGEEVAAALVLRRGGGDNVAAELQQRCREQLAGYKRPRRWFVLDQLPRTASGKVRKAELREMLRDAQPFLSER